MKHQFYLIFLVAGLVSCSEDTPLETLACDVTLADGSCAGVSRPEICSSSYCTGDSSCVEVWHVQEGATASGDGSAAHPFSTIEEGVKRATAGDCIALAAGSYTGTTLKAGVSLLGAGARHVTISSSDAGRPALALDGGADALLRGFTLSSAGVGLSVRGTQGTTIDQVRLEAAQGVGIEGRDAKQLVIQNTRIEKLGPASTGGGDAGHDAGAGDAGAPASTDHGIGVLLARGTTATLTGCAVQDCATQGILVDESDLILEKSAVSSSGLFGVVVQCATGCGGLTGSRITGTMITASQGIGLLVTGAKLEATDNDIGDTRHAAGFARGVQIQGGAAVVLRGNRVHHGVGQGIVLDSVTGTLEQNTVEGNQERGIWLQHISSPGLKLTQNTITANERAGLGATDSTAVTITGGRIEGTKKLDVMLQGKTGKVGDGIQVLGQSDVQISGVTLKDNERIGLIIDNARASASNTTIDGGDVALVVQNASLAQQSFSGLSGAGGPVTPVNPATPYLLNPTAVVSALPLPIP